MFSRATAVVLILLLSIACGRPAPGDASPFAGIHAEWPYLGRSKLIEAPHAMVVSGSPIASEVGRDILRRGGNAVDAAVAVGFSMAVVDPEAGNIGGGGFMVIRLSSGNVYVLDYRETAPQLASPDMFLDEFGLPTDKSVTGHLAVAVPGSVAGLVEAHRRLGRLPFTDVINPAIELAREGFVIDEKRSRSIQGDSARLSRFSGTQELFLPGGRVPRPGERLIQADLARTLEAVRENGADGFYRGQVAQLIVSEMQRGGGILSLADLAGYRAVWREPLEFHYRGFTLYSPPPPSAGGVVLGEIMAILEGFSPLPPFGSPSLLHIEAESMRRAYIDRYTELGDPSFVSNPVTRLLSAEYAGLLRQTIGARATPTVSVQLDSRRGPSTTHYSVIDSEGTAVSTTTSLNDLFGSAVTVTGAGFLLNDEMDDFVKQPRSPLAGGLVQGDKNQIKPGKRMLSSMVPTIVLDRNRDLYMVLGSRGGPRIISQVFQVISNVIDHRMDLAEAVAAPRMHHQAAPDILGVEPRGFLAAVLDSLRALGHQVDSLSPAGDVEAIMRWKGGLIGVSDPRSGGGGAGD